MVNSHSGARLQYPPRRKGVTRVRFHYDSVRAHALNNLYVLLMFGIVTSGLTLLDTSSGPSGGAAGYRAIHGLLWTTVGSVALGALFLTGVARTIPEPLHPAAGGDLV